MSKAYQRTIDEKTGYLHFRVTGPNTPQTVRGYLADVYYACAQRSCSTILVEENLQGPSLGLFDIFELASEGSERTWPDVCRGAYVDVNPQHSQRDMKFAETVAVNRGVNVPVFSSVQDAEAWLAEAGINR